MVRIEIEKPLDTDLLKWLLLLVAYDIVAIPSAEPGSIALNMVLFTTDDPPGFITSNSGLILQIFTTFLTLFVIKFIDTGFPRHFDNWINTKFGEEFFTVICKVKLSPTCISFC